MDPSVIASAANKLRARRCDLVAAYGYAGVQSRAVNALDEVAELWSDPAYPVRVRAQAKSGTFPFSMVEVSLSGLLPTWSARALRDLIDAEAPTISQAPDVIGHVIAGNTPLLGWTSVARALLVGSSSLVKVPTSAEAIWTDYFLDTLREVAPELAGMVDVLSWKGGGVEDGAFAASVDRLLVYGSDQTIVSYRSLSAVPVVGYGHMVSTALVLNGSDWDAAAEGLAADVLVYDQGGCLSPHTVFVEGCARTSRRFADRLRRAFAESAHGQQPLKPNAVRSARVREAREMALFEADVAIFGDERLRWTVIASPKCAFRVSPTHGVVYVVPCDMEALSSALSPVRPFLQGLAIARNEADPPMEGSIQILDFGVSYTCKPGQLQSPPFSWRENNMDVLRSLIV